MLIDIGVNLSNSRFEKDRPEVLQRARDAGVEKLILTGTSVSESESVVELCRQFADQFPGMLYATAGIHPHDAKSLNRESIATLKALTTEQHVVAIGEMGLDFNRNFSTPAQQEKAFEAQLELAAELQLPVFLHERDAAERQLQILRTYRDHLVDAVTHCFTGSREALYGYLDLDMYIGITGWVCDDKRGTGLQGLVADIPLQRLMVETDAPYLLPKTMPEPPKGKRNEPAFLPWVVSKIAEQRDESAEELAQQTSDNSLRFFRLE
ncbi:YchF/TatD family DNA exonuclease [SAR92 clade bacterium H455]|uniref:YchF/TatD family DNA exonuclease n=1 Tax=SAR92 clade bacterium H455 TaxID=2974818 RepID=A0ABY5TLJ3_9GAMM|nr:YchF/TatD family DNA exonuclease [SAR92 clade bacterium H455]